MSGTPPQSRLIQSARREAVTTLVVWTAALAWTVTYCATHGYGRSVDEINFVYGVPDWAFWGILVPWTSCTLFTMVFAFRIMSDDPLGDESDEQLGDLSELE